MARLPRKFRICKWVGTVGCLLTALAFLLSGWCGLGYGWGSEWSTAEVACFAKGYVSPDEGIMLFLHASGSGPSAVWITGWEFGASARSSWQALRVYPLPVIEHYQYPDPEFTYLAEHYQHVAPPPTDETYDQYRVLLPLWLPLLVLLTPTLWLWHRDRRKPRPGFCPRCDYDLTGNTTGRCPECGTPSDRGELK